GTSQSLDAIRAETELQLRNPATVPMKRRATQMAVSALFPALLTMGAVAAIVLMQRSQTADPRAFALKACVGNLKSFENRGSKMTAGQKEEVRLTEIYIAEHLRDAVEESAA